MEAVVVPVGRELYALGLEWIREIIAAPAVTRLATAPPSVMGLFNLRGNIVPLFDTAVLIGVGRVEEAPFAVVLDGHEGFVALAASALPWQTCLDVAIGPSELPATAGMYKLAERVVVLLDAGLIVAADRLRDPGVATALSPVGGA